MTPTQHYITSFLFEGAILVAAYFLSRNVEGRIRVGLSAYRRELTVLRVIMGGMVLLMLVSLALFVRDQ